VFGELDPGLESHQSSQSRVSVPILIYFFLLFFINLIFTTYELDTSNISIVWMKKLKHNYLFRVIRLKSGRIRTQNQVV
jgi:hypothetical protein